MLKVKSIKKNGKYLRIVIKKPYFMSVRNFMQKNNLVFKDDKVDNFSFCIKEDGDIELKFILSNYDDIRPYIMKTMK